MNVYKYFRFHKTGRSTRDCKTATKDAQLARTRKPEVEMWRKLHKRTRTRDFQFDFHRIYGRIYNHLAAENYFRSGRIFQHGGRRHLEVFKTFQILRVGRVNRGQCASPCQILWRSVKPLLRYDDFLYFFPRWRPSAILDLWCAYLDNPRRAFGGLHHCAKFVLNGYSSFDKSSFNVLRV